MRITRIRVSRISATLTLNPRIPDPRDRILRTLILWELILVILIEDQEHGDQCQQEQCRRISNTAQ
jgi:hypothetical protein